MAPVVDEVADPAFDPDWAGSVALDMTPVEVALALTWPLTTTAADWDWIDTDPPWVAPFATTTPDAETFVAPEVIATVPPEAGAVGLAFELPLALTAPPTVTIPLALTMTDPPCVWPFASKLPVLGTETV